MLNKIIEFSVKNKLIVGLMVFALLIVGIYQTTKLPIDAVPDITNNQVQIITSAPSYGATDIERLITFPIEQANNNIAGIKEIRSFSRFGLSLVTIVFEDDIDVYWARQQVAERITQVKDQIPKSIGVPTLGPITTGLGEVYQYVVRPKKGYEKKFDAIELRTIQDWIIRRQLLGVKGVAEVSSFGGKLKQYEIALNPDKLNAFGISISDVFTALEQNNQNTGGAYIEKGPTVLFIRTEGLIRNIDEIKNIFIKRNNSKLPLFLRDIAEVKIGFATRYGAMCYNDKGEVSGAVVMMLKGENSSEVIKLIKERIEQIKKTLPVGIAIEPFLDRTKMVNHAIETVEKNLLEGALIVLFVLVIFLGNIRAGLLVASVIPLSLLFAICLMNLFGVSGNLMSLGALDFGLIVDGAVIIVEAVIVGLSSKVLQTETLQKDKLIYNISSKMMNSAVFGQIIILVVYLPIFSLQGIEGKMFKPMAQTVAFSLLGAFILSITYIPMMSSLVLKSHQHNSKHFSQKLLHFFERSFIKRLQFLLQYPKTVITTVVVIFMGSLIVLSNLGGEFIPELEEGDFAVDTRLLPGSSLNTSIDYSQKAAKVLKSNFPEVEKVVTKIGSGEVPTDPMPIEAADMMVILKDKKQWTSARTFKELEEKMSNKLAEVPGLTFGFQYPVQMRFNELMTGARQDVVCKIFGENFDTLTAYADKIGKIVNTIKGAENLYVEPLEGMPQIVIEYNRAVMAQYNLNIELVNRIVNTAFAGESSGLLYEGEKRFDIVVRLNNNSKKNIDDIKNLLIPIDNEMQIPLQQIALVQQKNSVNQIQREDAKRRIIVGFNVKNRDIESIVKELNDKVEKQIKFPIGCYIKYGGAFENLKQAKDRLMIAVPISLLLIFVLLYFAFKNIKHALLIYSAVPLSTIGGILFLALRGMTFSISAGIGFIALFGVAVLNGIVLLAEFNKLKSESLLSLKEIVIEGTRNRLRPVLMTAFVASLGFLPMALSNGSGAEVQRPLATVVIGGLLIATFLTVFLLPILYMIFETGFSFKKSSIIKKTLIIGLVFILVQKATAQNSISLQAAIDSAIINNREIKNETLKTSYTNELINTYKDIPKTIFLNELGQINSPLFDNRIGVNQSIPFPTVFAKQKQVLIAESLSQAFLKDIKTYEIKKVITQLFYEYYNLKSREVLLLQIDSLYTSFYDKALLRLQKGESNLLEKTTAQTQKANVVLQLNQLKQEINNNLLMLQLIMNTTQVYQPFQGNLINKQIAKIDTSILNNHPTLQYLEQEIIVQKNRTKLETEKLKPDVSFGVSNVSYTGIASDNKEYNISNRFTSAQIGLGFSIFNSSQKSRIKSSKISEQIAVNNSLLAKDVLSIKMKKLINTYKSNVEMLQYFEQEGLTNATTIKETASKQFINGEINYLDFVMLLNNAISIEVNYLDAILKLNNIIIDINFITN